MRDLHFLFRTDFVFLKADCLWSQAYSSSMTGNTLLEREDYSNALEKFARASTIYSQLAKFPIAPSLAFLFTEKVSQLEPSIRYCNLRTGGEVSCFVLVTVCILLMRMLRNQCGMNREMIFRLWLS